MTAPNRELFKNNASSPLNGGIDASQTTLDVDDGSVFPSTGNFRLIIGSELLICTARSTNTLTVTRGAEGSTGASHADDAAVTMIVTEGGLLRALADSAPFGGAASFPPWNKLVASNGTTLLTSADFAWTNQGTASVADFAGTLALRVPSTANEQHRILTVAVPAAPWTCIMAIKIFVPGPLPNTNCQLGVCVRESGTTRIYTFGLNRQSGNAMRYAIDKWTVNTFSSTPFIANIPIGVPDVLWMKVNDNNTNLIFSVSSDGVDWVDVLSESRTTFFTTGPDQIGISGNNGTDSSAKDAIVRLLHFHFE